MPSTDRQGGRESGSTYSEGIVKYWNTLTKYPGYFGNYTFTPTSITAIRPRRS